MSGWEGNQSKVTTILKNMDINMKLLSIGLVIEASSKLFKVGK
jgi:hypothetical protein